MQEEHVLERWRASPSPMKGVCSVREKQKFLTRGGGVREWRGFLSYRGAQMNRTHRIFLSHRITQITRVRRFLLSHRFTQMNRTHSIPQRPCGRQISQNLTAIFSWNALWSLYAEGLLWARNVRKNALLTLCALWEIKLPTTPIGRLVGVTSHFTPLPTGEGKGEGPTGAGGEATVCSVRENVF